MPFKMKLLRVNISKRKLIIIFVATGLSIWVFSISLTAPVSSCLRILAYRDLKSIDTNILSYASSGMFLTF